MRNNSINIKINSNSNPAELYIKSLQSNNSKILMKSRLNIICKKIDKNSNYLNIDWSILSYELVLNVIENLKNESKAPATINSYIAAIKGVTKQAWKRKIIKTSTYLWINDIKDINGSRINTGRTLSTNEILKLIKSCNKNKDISGIRDAAIIAITYGAGLRRDETANLKINDYNIKEGTIKIIGKGNKERKNKINKKIQEVIKRWINCRNKNSEYIFYTIKDNNHVFEKKLSGGNIYTMLKKRYIEAKIDKISPHDLRRTYATKLLEQGHDIFIVQELMGHTSIDTTKKYDRRSETFKNKAAEALPF